MHRRSCIIYEEQWSHLSLTTITTIRTRGIFYSLLLKCSSSLQKKGDKNPPKMYCLLNPREIYSKQNGMFGKYVKYFSPYMKFCKHIRNISQETNCLCSGVAFKFRKIWTISTHGKWLDIGL